MADNLTFTVNRKGATDGGAAVPSGTDTALSFLVVAWYTAAETDNDNAGWVLTIPANWKNKSTDLTGTVAIPVVKPVRNGVVQYVDHYTVYYQKAADFTLGSAAFKADTVTESAETATTVTLTIDDLDDTAGGTFAAAMTTFTTLDGMMRDFKGEPRQNVTKGAAGSVQPKSWAQDVTWEVLNMVFGMTTTTGANFRKILKWMRGAVPITITDNSSNKYITSYDGCFMGANYPANDGMNPNIETPLQFWVEAETLA